MHYINEILSPLSECCASDASESECKLIVHAENASLCIIRLSVAFFKDHGMETVPHPPYSSDIVPSDFSFGHVKRCLAGRSFLDAEKLSEAVRGVLGSIEKVTL
jgi:hypothetical protein